MDEPRLLAAGNCLPFIEAGDRNQAATGFECRLKTRFLMDRLAPSNDQFNGLARVWFLGGHQSPAQAMGHPLPRGALADYWHVLQRPQVVAWRPLQFLAQGSEVVQKYRRRNVERVTATHGRQDKPNKLRRTGDYAGPRKAKAPRGGVVGLSDRLEGGGNRSVRLLGFSAWVEDTG